MGKRSKNVTYNTPNYCFINFTLRRIDIRKHHKTSTTNIRTDTKQGRETSFRSFCDLTYKKENAFCEAGFPTLAEMKELNTTIVAIRILMNERHPIRYFFTNRRMQDEYAMRKGTLSPIFMKESGDSAQLQPGPIDDRHARTSAWTSSCVASPKEPGENEL
jgi:hypothetical protein